MAESWMVYWPTEAQALPWPFAEAWQTIVAERLPLDGAFDWFGQVALTDRDELPAVPPQLPREVPKGQYRLGVYHQPEWITLVVDATFGPAITTPEEVARQVPGSHRTPVCVTLGIARQRTLWRWWRHPDGSHGGQSGPLWYGPRQPTSYEPLPEASFAEADDDGWYRCAWRIARAPGLDALDFGCSLYSCATLENVALGAGMAWAPRRDGFVCIRLVDAPEPAPGPELETLHLEYDPATESGAWRMRWRDLYGPGERLDSSSHPLRVLHDDIAAIRLNGEMRSYPLAPQVATEPWPLAEGHNRLEVVTAGGNPVRLWVEKRSGNRIIAPAVPAHEPLSLADYRALIEPELVDLEGRLARHADGRETLDLLRWPLYSAVACGIADRFLRPEPRFREVLRAIADFGLSLQREDGTFSGFHLRRKMPDDGVRWKGGAYDSGQAGEMWVVAAAVLGDAKYLDASRRLVRAYATYRIEFNHNFAAFALFHLAAHYRLTGEEEALAHGLYYARHLVAKQILPLGYHEGHNYYTVYGFIILRGLARFAAVLPVDHPERARLTELCRRMTNQLLSRLQPDGTFDSVDRWFVGEKLWSSGPFSVAFLLPADQVRALDPVLQHLLHAPRETLRCRLLDGDVIRYLVHRDALLMGECPPDLLQ